MYIDRSEAHKSQSLWNNAGSLLWSEDPVTLDKLLASVGILPEAYLSLRASLSPRSPEAAMMCAVLEDALDCFQKQFVSRPCKAFRPRGRGVVFQRRVPLALFLRVYLRCARSAPGLHSPWPQTAG